MVAYITFVLLPVIGRKQRYTTSVHKQNISSKHQFKTSFQNISSLIQMKKTIENKMIPSSLDPSYRNTLVRLGTDLDFDFNQCPRTKSLMLQRDPDFSPKHLNCPTLFLIGARKGGTTSLYQYISKHPDFEGILLDAGPKAGETFYFSSHHYESRMSWKEYLSLFPLGGRMSGDASVANLVHYLAPQRLYESCGKQVKLKWSCSLEIRSIELNQTF